ncbi:MAG: hypothetical protein ACLRSY_02790 [Acutalibacter sp.]
MGLGEGHRRIHPQTYLKDTVRRIVSAICGTLDELKWQFSSLDTDLSRDVFFICQGWRTCTPHPPRSGRASSQAKTVFIQQMAAS